MTVGDLRALRALWLLYWWRWRNRLAHVLRFSRRRDRNARAPTARRGRAGAWVALVLGPLFLFQAGVLSQIFLGNLAAHWRDRIETAGVWAVDPALHERMLEFDDRRELADPAAGRALDDLRDHVRQWLEYGSDRTARQLDAETELHMRRFAEHGSAGFRPAAETGFRLPDAVAELAAEAEGGAFLLRAVGVLVLAIWLGLLLMSAGGSRRDARTEWSMEWFFSLPIRAQVLFAGRILEAGWFNVFGWIVLMPLLAVVFWNFGLGWWTAALAPATTAVILLQLGSVQAVVETMLRKRLAPATFTNLQAVALVAGTMLWFFALALALSAPLTSWLADAVAPLRSWWLWNPLTLPLLVTDAALAPPAAAGTLVLAVAVPAAAAAHCARQTRDGLSAARGAPARGTRGRGPQFAASGWLRGVVRKELLLLRRDTTFLVQSLVVPILVLGFQVLLNPGLLHLTWEFRNAATLAYGVGAYVLAFSAARVLVSEGGALWILHTLPHDLTRLLLRKTALWCGCALAYALVVLGIGIAQGGWGGWAHAADVAVVIVALCISAFLAAGMGILGTEPLEQVNAATRMRPALGLSYLLVAGCLGYAVHSPVAWDKVVLLLLAAALTAAIWEQAHARLPILLDPTARPAPRLALADGLIAVFAFFVVQRLLLAIGVRAGMEDAALLVVLSFFGAGAVTVLVAVLVLARRLGPAQLLVAVRIAGPVPGQGAVLLGCLAGGLAGVVGLGWLQLAEHVPALHALRPPLQPGQHRWFRDHVQLIALLGVVLAPLFEEFLFRGLVFGALRRSMSFAPAALASAVLFAAVHPPFSAVPVFVMALGAALLLEHTGSLFAAIAMHAAYNAVVLFAS